MLLICMFEIKIIFYLHWFCYSSCFVADDLDTTGSDSKLEIPRQNADRLGNTSHPTKVLDVTFRLEIKHSSLRGWLVTGKKFTGK